MPFFGGGSGDYLIVGTNIKGGTGAAPAVIGDNNMALGNGALDSIINGDRNIAIGNGALNVSVNPLDNVAIGYYAAGLVTSADKSVAIGGISAQSVGYLTSSVIIGYGAASESNLISDTVAIGLNAFASPAGNFDRAQGSVAVGAGAGYGYKTEYTDSVLVGANAGTNNGIVAGQYLTSVFIGTNCGSSNVKANYQDCIGIGANTYSGDGTAATQLGAIVIGANSGPSPGNTDISNSIGIGYGVPVTGPDKIIIGGASHTDVKIGGYPVVRMLFNDGVAVIAPNDLSTNTLQSTVIPAGIIGKNGFLEITLTFINSASINTTIELRFNNDPVVAFFITAASAGSATVKLTSSNSLTVNSASLVRVLGNATSTVNIGNNNNIDFSVPVTLDITCTKSTVGLNFTLESTTILFAHAGV